MYERTSFPATPKWARHLLRLSNASTVPVDASLRDLARQLSYDVASLPAHLRLSRKEHDAIQYLLDWNGRAVMLDRKEMGFSRHVIAMAANALGSKSIWVICRGSVEIYEWWKILERMYPADQIYAQKSKDSVELVVANPDENRRWILSDYRSIINSSDIIGPHKTDHIVFEKDEKDLPYDSTDALSGLCSEMKRVTMLYQSPEFWVDQTDFRAQSAMGLLSLLLSEYLRLNSFMAKVPIMYGTSQSVSGYFRKRSRRYDPVRLFEASGACFDLVMEKTSHNFKNVFSNSMAVSAGSGSNRRDSAIRKHNQAESELCVARSQSMDQIVSAATAGSADARAALESLKTLEWAKLKSAMFYNFIRSTQETKEKVVIVAKNPHIRKYMSTSLNAMEVDDNPMPQLHEKFANFVYPDKSYRSFEHLTVNYACRISNILMTSDITVLDPRVLVAANHVVFAEFHYNSEIIADYIELSKLFDFTITFGTMRGTFEEHLSELILENHH